MYPYALTLPPKTALKVWRPATKKWDGELRIDTISSYIDANAIAEGGLYLFGAPAPDGLEAFLGRVAGNGTRFHGCSEAAGRRDMTIGDVPAIGFTQKCGGGMEFGRAVIVRDGFGVAAMVSAAPGGAAAALDRLIELLDGLEWRTG